jgi:hypothetical protein
MPCYYAVCNCLGEKGWPDTAKSRKEKEVFSYFLTRFLTDFYIRYADFNGGGLF